MRFNYAFECEGDTSKNGSNTVNNVKYKSNTLLANQSSKFSAMASSDIPLLACSPEIIETLRLFNDGTREIHAVQTVVRRKHENDPPLIITRVLYVLFFSSSSCWFASFNIAGFSRGRTCTNHADATALP